MPVQSGNGPAFKVLLANKKVDEFKLINSGKDRISRYIKIRDFSGSDRNLIKHFQGQIIAFGVHGNKGDRFGFNDVGMGPMGFKMIIAMMMEYKYKYVYIYPNDYDYDTSIKTAVRAQADDANVHNDTLYFPHDVYISNSDQHLHNTPIFNNSNEVWEPESGNYVKFDPQHAKSYSVLSSQDNEVAKRLNGTIDAEDNPGTPAPNVKLPRTPQRPNDQSGDTSMTPSSQSHTETPSTPSPSEGSTTQASVSSTPTSTPPPRDKGKQPEGQPPRPKPKASSSGTQPSGSGAPPQEPENVARRVFDPDEPDSLRSNAINKVGNKYLSDKFKFNMNPKLLKHSPFVTDILHKHGRKNRLYGETEKKVRESYTYKRFFEK